MCESDKLFLATGGYDHTIKMWNVRACTCYHTLTFTDSQINQLNLTRDKQYLAAAGYRKIRMYDIKSGHVNPIVNYEGVPKNVTNVGFVENGKWMYTAGEDTKVRIWDLRVRTPQCQRLFPAGSGVNCVTLHPNQQEIIFGDQNGVIYLWNLGTDQNEQLVPENQVSVLSIDINREGTILAAVNNRGKCYIWYFRTEIEQDSYETDKLIPRYKFNAHNSYVLKCKFSPNSKYLATSSADQTTRIWRLEDFSLVQELKHEHQQWVWDVAFSADSKMIFTASSDGIVKLWNIENGTKERQYAGHQKAVTSIAFHDSIVSRN